MKRNNNSSKEILKEAAFRMAVTEYIDTINKHLIETNRFFTDEKFLAILKELCNQSSIIIPKGTIMYRARVYHCPDKQIKKLGYFEEGVFEGYDEKNSFVNKQSEWPLFGRMNPSGIRVLYVSTDVKTCVRENNPAYDELISVAKIELQSDLTIADFAHVKSQDNNPLNFYRLYIQELLSSGNSEKDYIFSQYIAAFCEKQGFDGIGCRSKFSRKTDTNQDNGINYSIFHFDKCKAISSKLVRVENTTIKLEDVNAKLPAVDFAMPLVELPPIEELF